MSLTIKRTPLELPILSNHSEEAPINSLSRKKNDPPGGLAMTSPSSEYQAIQATAAPIFESTPPLPSAPSLEPQVKQANVVPIFASAPPPFPSAPSLEIEGAKEAIEGSNNLSAPALYVINDNINAQHLPAASAFPLDYRSRLAAIYRNALDTFLAYNAKLIADTAKSMTDTAQLIACTNKHIAATNTFISDTAKSIGAPIKKEELSKAHSAAVSVKKPVPGKRNNFALYTSIRVDDNEIHELKLNTKINALYGNIGLNRKVDGFKLCESILSDTQIDFAIKVNLLVNLATKESLVASCPVLKSILEDAAEAFVGSFTIDELRSQWQHRKYCFFK